MNTSDLDRFKDLNFEQFKRLAKDESLSPFEKIGFPNSYREGREDGIFADIRAKLTNLERPAQTVFDIGSGCSGLPRLLIDVCQHLGHTLICIDSEEMLRHLPDAPFLSKVPARFPHCPDTLEHFAGRVDVVIAYSLLHYIFAESNPFDFLDRSLALLSPGGQMLVGDIPNISKRKRFFSSPAGIKFHQTFMDTREAPSVDFNRIESGQIDDAAILAFVARSRAAGFDAYIMPQAPDLPMANRREDILIVKP